MNTKNVRYPKKLFVIYNGGRVSKKRFTNPIKHLKIGQIYEIDKIVSYDDCCCKNYYTLKGVKGKYYYRWFDPVWYMQVRSSGGKWVSVKWVSRNQEFPS